MFAWLSACPVHVPALKAGMGQQRLKRVVAASCDLRFGVAVLQHFGIMSSLPKDSGVYGPRNRIRSLGKTVGFGVSWDEEVVLQEPDSVRLTCQNRERILYARNPEGPSTPELGT